MDRDFLGDSKMAKMKKGLKADNAAGCCDQEN